MLPVFVMLVKSINQPINLNSLSTMELEIRSLGQE
jgi:hypothetical protein